MTYINIFLLSCITALIANINPYLMIHPTLISTFSSLGLLQFPYNESGKIKLCWSFLNIIFQSLET